MRQQASPRHLSFDQQHRSAPRTATAGLVQAVARGLSPRTLGADALGTAFRSLQRSVGNGAVAALVQRDWDDYLPTADIRKGEIGLTAGDLWLEIKVHEVGDGSAEQIKDIPVAAAVMHGSTARNPFTLDFGLGSLVTGSADVVSERTSRLDVAQTGSLTPSSAAQHPASASAHAATAILVDFSEAPGMTVEEFRELVGKR